MKYTIKKILIGMLVALVLLPVTSYAHVLGEEHDHVVQPTWEERQAKIKAIVDAELEHIRAVRLEQAKAETYARAALLESPRIYVSSYATSRNNITNTLSQENTASATQ